MFRQKDSSSKLASSRTPKFSQNIYKSIKLKVTENQIDRIIQNDVVKKSLQGRAESAPPTPMKNRVNKFLY